MRKHFIDINKALYKHIAPNKTLCITGKDGKCVTKMFSAIFFSLYYLSTLPSCVICVFL